jgi:hypothetical protein
VASFFGYFSDIGNPTLPNIEATFQHFPITKIDFFCTWWVYFALWKCRQGVDGSTLLAISAVGREMWISCLSASRVDRFLFLPGQDLRSNIFRDGN